MFPLFRNTEVRPYVRTLRSAVSYILLLTSGDSYLKIRKNKQTYPTERETLSERYTS